MTLQLPGALEREIIAKGRWLRHWRNYAGASVTELSLKTGIPVARLDRIEDDLVYPEQEEIEAIAKALGTTADAIIAVQD
jgi:transcriptional regulator with XRE-family HTH domain